MRENEDWHVARASNFITFLGVASPKISIPIAANQISIDTVIRVTRPNVERTETFPEILKLFNRSGENKNLGRAKRFPNERYFDVSRRARVLSYRSERLIEDKTRVIFKNIRDYFFVEEEYIQVI